MSSDMLSPSRVARSKSMPHVDLKRVRLQKQDSNLSEDSSSGFKDSGIERDDNLANSSSDIQQDFPSIQSNSSSGVGSNNRCCNNRSGYPCTMATVCGVHWKTV